MRHHRLFAAGLAAALMLGAASPALAAPGNKGKKGNPPGHSKPKPTKPAPKPHTNNKSGVSGGGSIGTGEFSIQARLKHPTKGHFNYASTDGSFTVRCHSGFVPFDAPTGDYPRTVEVTFNNCAVTGQAPGPVVVKVTDVGQHATAPAVDEIHFLTLGGPLTGGNIKVR